jgi:hypothetical protein
MRSPQVSRSEPKASEDHQAGIPPLQRPAVRAADPVRDVGELDERLVRE